MLATAADIPQELFDDVLWHAADLQNDYSPDKHQLCKYSQVCTRWATRCRPRLFATIRIDSASDLHELKILLRSEPVAFLGPIGGNIRRLDINVQYSYIEPPWVHHLFLGSPLSCYLHPGCKITISVEEKDKSSGGETQPDVPRIGPLNHIPRLIPSTQMKISEVKLHNVHFRYPAEFRRLLLQLTQCIWVDVTAITWDTHTQLDRPASIRKLPFPLGTVRCSLLFFNSNTLHLAPWLVNSKLMSRGLEMFPEDHVALLSIVELAREFIPGQEYLWRIDGCKS